MGCSNPKEKLEEEMLKVKMERCALQMERYKQLKLLKEIDGCEIEPPKIPDYLEPSSNNDNKDKEENQDKSNKDNNIKIKRRNKSKISKTLMTKNNNHNNKIFNSEEEEKEEKEEKENIFLRKGKKRNTYKKKTMKY